MKKAVLLLFISFSFVLSAQVTNEGAPESWKWGNNKNLNAITMPSFDLKALQAEDAATDRLGDRPWRFGKDFIVNYDINNSGEWTELENGDRVWRIRFQSKGAITMNFLFEDFYLPPGGKIYLYSNDRTDLLGAYTQIENNDAKTLGTWLVDSDDVWIEYFEPAKVAEQGSLTVTKVVHGYRSQSQYMIEKGLNDSGNCNHDVDCPIDDELEDFKNHNKKGVALILAGGSTSWCSGSLINNTANDGTPYFLTANHCISGPGSNPSNWVLRFNWISPDPVCATTANSTNGPTNFILSGATLRASRFNSDFALVETNNPVPSDWDAVWAGWDRTDDIPGKTWGIHHPAGDIMKVCVDRDAPGSLNANQQPVWRIHNWELGVTEGGSSGSPLFDPEGRIIGQLWRGTATCSGTSPVGYDEYGRFAASWADGGTTTSQLKDWLDPTNSDVMTLDPYPPMQTFNVNASIAITNIPALLCDSEISPILKIRNHGTETLVSADISYQLNDGASTSIEWTGSLDTGEEEEISLGAIAINSAGTFSATLENPNGVEDEFPGNNSASRSFDLPDSFETSEVHFTLIPDNYGSETTWNFVNSAGTVLYSGGPYSNNNNNPINVTFTLSSDDCYTFTIFDSWGDGICCQYGNGSYKLETAEGDLIVQGGNFGSSESTTFSNFNLLNTIENNWESSVSLYPNPTNGMLNIANNTGNSLDFEVYNLLGQSVTNGNISSNLHTLDLSNVKSGLYFVKLTDRKTNTSITKKVVLR